MIFPSTWILSNVVRSVSVGKLDPGIGGQLLSLSLSDWLNWKVFLDLSYQMQVQNFGHVSFTFKRNHVIVFITGSSKSEIRKKAGWQWLMPQAFSWFAD